MDSDSLPDRPKFALEAYIRTLEGKDYYVWYEKASSRNFYLWAVTQVTAVVSGFGAQAKGFVAVSARDPRLSPTGKSS